MALYEMQESNLPAQDGGRTLFPRLQLRGQMDLEEAAQEVHQSNTFTVGEVLGVVRALAEVMARAMAEGRSVKIDGIGTFTPGLGLREGAERETGLAGDPRRNAASLCVDRIRFRADKELVKETDRRCTLERAGRKFRKSSARYTPEERLRLAQEYLESHPYLTVLEYASLTGLLHDAAARELRRWREDASSGIVSSGYGSHKVYVRRR